MTGNVTEVVPVSDRPAVVDSLAEELAQRLDETTRTTLTRITVALAERIGEIQAGQSTIREEIQHLGGELQEVLRGTLEREERHREEFQAQEEQHSEELAALGEELNQERESAQKAQETAQKNQEELKAELTAIREELTELKKPWWKFWRSR